MSVYSKDVIDENFHSLVSYLKSCSRSKSFLFLEKEKILLKTSFQGIFNLTFDNEVKKIIHQILIETCIKAEKLSPGGFEATLQKILDPQTTSCLESYFPNFENMENIVKNIFQGNECLKSSILEAVKIAGFGGRISIEKSSNDLISVEEINGFFFKVKSTFETRSIILKKPKIICIDGYVESVSELNRLFEGAAETKAPLVIVTRGFHDDVMNTIKINRSRGSMFVYPVLVEFDLNGINKINDISIASRQTPISSNLGQLISNISIEDGSRVDEITLNKDSILIKDSLASREISRHISFLLQQRNEKTGAEEIFDERIKSLANKNVIVRIPDSNEFVANNQRIDFTLRSIKSMLDLGVTESGQLFSVNVVSDIFSKDFLSLLENLGAFVKKD